MGSCFTRIDDDVGRIGQFFTEAAKPTKDFFFCECQPTLVGCVVAVMEGQGLFEQEVCDGIGYAGVVYFEGLLAVASKCQAGAEAYAYLPRYAV